MLCNCYSDGRLEEGLETPWKLLGPWTVSIFQPTLWLKWNSGVDNQDAPKFDQSTPTGFDCFDLFEFCRFRPLLQCLGPSGWALTEVMWSDTNNWSLHSFLSWKKWHALFSALISDSSLIHLAGGCHIAIIPEVHTKKVELWNLPRTLRGELRVLCWHSDVGGRDHAWKNLKQEDEKKI